MSRPPSREGPAAPSPREARRQRRQERSREEILDAARRVVLRDGLASTTLAAVASEVGLTKAALYYYFPSKDALLQELMLRQMEEQAEALSGAVARVSGGGPALRAIIAETIAGFAPRMDDFRMAYLVPQVEGPGVVDIGPDTLARIRPFNDRMYGETARRLAAQGPGRAGIDPRLLTFLAHLAALGVLTMKGLVETSDDPLRYGDAELIDALARVFEAAAEPG